MTDRDLLAEYARTGSAEALSAIIERHSALVYATCLRVLRDAHAAEDATQATFLILMRRAKTLPPDSVLPGWLYATAQNAARNLIRSTARRARNERNSHAMPQRRPAELTDPAEREELTAQLDAALGALPPAQRNAVILRYFYGRENREAAAQLGCSPATLEVQLSRALARMREFLQRRGVTVSASVLAGVLLDATPPAAVSLTGAIQAACLGKTAASAAALALANSAGKSTAAWLSSKVLVVTALAALTVAAPLSYSYFAKAPSAPAVPRPAALPPGSKVLFEAHRFKTADGWRGEPQVGKDAADDEKAIHSVPLENAAEASAFTGEVRSPWSETGWTVGSHTYLRFRILPLDFTSTEQLKFMFKRGDQMNFSAVLAAPLKSEWQTVTIPISPTLVLDADHHTKLPAGEMLHQLIWQARSDATPPNAKAQFWIDDVILFEAPADIPAQALAEPL